MHKLFMNQLFWTFFFLLGSAPIVLFYDFSGMLLFWAFLSLILGAYRLYFVLKTLGWETVEMSVAENEINYYKAWSAAPGVAAYQSEYCEPRVSYQYVFQGKAYKGNRVNWWKPDISEPLNHKFEIEKTLSKIVKEKTVYVNPNNPEESVIIKSFSTGYYAMTGVLLLMSIIFFVFGYMMLVSS